MLVSNLKDEDLTTELIERLLFNGITDTGGVADCILVLGSKKAAQYRVPVAVSAYKAGRSAKIMLCGGKVRDFPAGKCTEAENMHQAALDLGVPNENIIVENSSQNTVENILFAMIELQRNFCLNNIKAILLVTTAYHMRRSLAIARYFLPTHITIIPCPADDTHTRQDNWTTTSIGVERATKEAKNIINYIHNGVIPDFEI